MSVDNRIWPNWNNTSIYPTKPVCNVLAVYETHEYSIHFAQFIRTFLRVLEVYVDAQRFV